MNLVPLKVHINEGVPTDVEFLRPGETPDKYTPPDKSPVHQIRKAVQGRGALNICQEGGRLFATFKGSKISEVTYGQKIPVEDVDDHKYDNFLERFRAAVSKPFFDLTLKYLYGEVEVETYLAQTADASPNDITAASMYLFRTLWFDNFRAMARTRYSDEEEKIAYLLDMPPDTYVSKRASQNWGRLAEAYMALHMTKEAPAIFRWSVKLNPKDPDNWRDLAATHHVHHQADPAKRKDALGEAAMAYAKVVELGGSIEGTVIPNTPSLTLDENDPATEALERAIETRLRSLTELEEKGEGVPSHVRKASERLESFGKRLRSAKEAYKLCRGHGAWSLFTNGLKLLTLGRPAETIERINQSLSSRPDWGDALDDLGQALIWDDRLEEAISAFKKATDKGTRDTIGTRWRLAKTMSKLYSMQGQSNFDMLSDVFTVLFSIAEDQPDSTDTELWLALARVSHEMSRYEPDFLYNTILYYEKVAELYPYNPESWRILAQVYNQIGRTADSLHAAKQELLALERMLANIRGSEKAEAIKARIQELREILDKTDPEDPEGSSTPQASPADQNGTPLPQGPGSDRLMRSPLSVGGFHNNNDEVLFTPSTSSTESAELFYNYETSTLDPGAEDMGTAMDPADQAFDLSSQISVEFVYTSPAAMH